MRHARTILIAAVSLCAAPLHAQALGTFTGSVQNQRGDQRSTLAGTALACLNDADPRDVDTFILLRAPDGREIMVVLATPAPQPGEYPLDYVNRDDMTPMVSLDVPRADGRKNVYTGRSGVLTITGASADRVQGNVRFGGEEISNATAGVRVWAEFNAERVGGMTGGDCVRPAAGAAPTASASAAVAGAQVAPGTAVLALRNARESIPNTGSIDFCPGEEGLIFGIDMGEDIRVIIGGVPPRAGSFTVGIEDNEIHVGLRSPGAPSWIGESGFVRITSIEGQRVRGTLEVRIRQIGAPEDAGYMELGGVFDALQFPNCRRG